VEAADPRPQKRNRTDLARGWRAAAVWVLSLIVRLWVRTLRFECSPADLDVGRSNPGPAVILLWHNRGAFSIPWLLRTIRRDRPVYALVSASRDGATMGRFFHILGLRLVHGSSSRFGREALHDMVACLRAGHDVALTPDGPRGPVYDLKAGAVLAARRVRAPVLLAGIDFRNAWRLRSWDRYFVPKPFSRAVIRFEMVGPDALGKGDEALAHLRERLLELSGAAGEARASAVAIAPEGDS
jgi:hypothetical protein